MQLRRGEKMSNKKDIKNEEDLDIENFKLFASNITQEELVFIKSLLDQDRSEEIDRILELWLEKQFNKKDEKNNSSSSGDDDFIWLYRRLWLDKMPKSSDIEFDLGDMDSQSLELLLILTLISEYIKEKDEKKKKSLSNRIQSEIEKYRRKRIIPKIVPKKSLK